MATAVCYYSSKLLIISLITLFYSCTGTITFSITNNCPHTIWPGTLAGSGTPQLATTGFQLDSGQSIGIPGVPKHWSGRIWARTGCRFNAANIPGSLEGSTSCQTGDCGGRLECDGIGATPPASLFEITLGDEKDYYDVSLVDGYNLPLVVVPNRGDIGGGCNITGCITDINMSCPKELEVIGADRDNSEIGSVVGCKSACQAFGSEQYCCSGEYANPGTCRPSMYSGMFKKACPRAYTYAFDDGTSTFTCSSPHGYSIVFCPTSGMRRIDDPPIRESQIEKIGAVIVSPSSSSLAASIVDRPLLPFLAIFVAMASTSSLILSCF